MANPEISQIQEVSSHDAVTPSAEDEKHHMHSEKQGADEIAVANDVDGIVAAVLEGREITPEMRQKVAEQYGRAAEEDQLAPRADVTAILERIITMTDEEAVDVLVRAIEYHKVRQPSYQRETLTAPGANNDKG